MSLTKGQPPYRQGKTIFNPGTLKEHTEDNGNGNGLSLSIYPLPRMTTSPAVLQINRNEVPKSLESNCIVETPVCQEQNAFKSKSNLAKLHWWNAPPPPPPTYSLELNRAIQSKLVTKPSLFSAEATDLLPTVIAAPQNGLRVEQTKNSTLEITTITINNNNSSSKEHRKSGAIRVRASHKRNLDKSYPNHKAHHHHNHNYSNEQQEQKPVLHHNDDATLNTTHCVKCQKPGPGSVLPSTTQNFNCGVDNCQDNEENISQVSQLLAEDPEPRVGLLNQHEDDEMQVTGYNRSFMRTFLCWICICLTGGLLRLVLHWWRHWYLIATHKKCSLALAEKVLVEEHYQGKHKIFYVKDVHNISVGDLRNIFGQQSSPSKDGFIKPSACLSVHFSAAQFKYSENVRIFNCKQLRYAWDNQTHSFNKLRGLDANISCAYFYQQKGLSAQEQLSRRLVYGPNDITIPYKDVKTLLFLEILNPFYVFQTFSVVLWFTYDYYYYACVILLMTIFGISMSIRQTKKNQDSLRETVQNVGCALVASEKGTIREQPTQNLVPGDIIEIPSTGCTMQCDAVLLSGNCILDESMLTGESVPVTKTPLPMRHDVIFDKKEHARHTLFSGTKIIQTRYIGSEKVLAIVINTGNITAKGGLIRSILYPPPVDYKFEQDSYKFIECLALIALIGFIYTLVTKIMRDVGAVKIAVESLDLITIVVPPALPAAMTVGRLYAQKRLEHKNIYCIAPRSINVAGSIDCCCFDKTGTLTEDGLDMWGVVPKTVTKQFQMPVRDIDRLPFDSLLFGMATCHSITIMNGKLMGDPLDLKMFESTGWILEDPKDIPDSQKYGLIHPTIVRPSKKETPESLAQDNEQNLQNTQRQSSVEDLLADVGLLNGESRNDHGVVREFSFTSNLQRMSVITRRFCERNFCVYCKGSPEMVQQLCQPSSLPENYSQQLAIFAKQGYRVIAMASKPLSPKISYTKVQRLSRESVESDLEFLGFVVLENRLKPDTAEVINALTAAKIRTIMVTGDNILTALSVARDCGIVLPTQAVVTVNVRQLDQQTVPDPDPQRTHVPSTPNYELYYTLELSSKGCNHPVILNGNSVRRFDTNAESDGCHGGYTLFNGDVRFLGSSSSLMLPNSSSLASVQTCDTWTHQDVELGLNSSTAVMNATMAAVLDKDEPWRLDYRFAMVGKTWQVVRDHFPEEMTKFIARGAIFARMAPEQKQALIMELQSIDYCVAMCGDGANDCGALKVAHAGISLSEAESSIASPFTSRNATIACVPNVIKEGRAALVTSFGIFKYMAAYSMVQFISVMILYSIDSNLTDKQYLYIDLFIISIIAFFFGKTDVYVGPLAKQVPLSSLISITPLVSIILHLLVVVAFQVAGWFQLQQQSWFESFKFTNEEHLGCYENYTLFAISSFQYIILAFVFSKGAPYRKPIWCNIPLCLTIIINICIVVYLIVYPTPAVAQFFQLVMPPVLSFRCLMLTYGVLNFIVHVCVETFIVELIIFKKFQVRREQNVLKSKRKYIKIENRLKYLRSWPPISEIEQACEPLNGEDLKPTYVEIRAQQSNELPTPSNSALKSFFETDVLTGVGGGIESPQTT